MRPARADEAEQSNVSPSYLSPRKDRIAITTTIAPMIQIMLFMDGSTPVDDTDGVRETDSAKSPVQLGQGFPGVPYVLLSGLENS